MTTRAAFCGLIRWSASGSRLGKLVIKVLPPSLRSGYRGAHADGSRQNTLPAAGRRSGRCRHEPDLGPHPCTDLGDGRCDLRNVAGAQEEVVLPLRQRTEFEVDAGGARSFRELLGVVDEELVLAVVDDRWRQPGRIGLGEVDPR